MKCSVVFALIFFAICIYAALGQSHNVAWGTLGPHDILLDREILVKKYKFLRVVDGDFTYPREGYYNNYTITSVRCIDQYRDGDGGYATLVKGGPGSKDVTIDFESRRNHGFNFIVEVYGQ